MEARRSPYDGSMPDEQPSAALLWPIYGRHAAAVLRHGPRPVAAQGPGWSLALSGAGHVDLNQVALYAGANPGAVREVVGQAVASEAPILLGVSGGVAIAVDEILEAAGFLRSQSEEALFWAPTASPPTDTRFEARRATSPVDLAGIARIFGAVHDYEPELVESMYGQAVQDDPAIEAWLALDGDDPVSCAFVTHVERTLGLFDVMTPPRHRRRGAARALIDAALGSAAATQPGGIEGIVFWASPAGRPLYESLGFDIADLVSVWTLGASPEDLAAVGAG